MATDYTANYNLDKYTANDKPNLRDQYNAAMDKIDAQLLIANNNASLAVRTAQEAAGEIGDAVSEEEFDAFVEQTNNALANKANSSALSSEAQTRQQADAALGARIDSLGAGPKYMVVIGDSFSMSQGGYAGTPYWHAYVGVSLGVTVKNFASGSTGFVKPSATNRPFLTQIAEASADTSFENNAVAYVVIYGGVNDGTDLTTQAVYNVIAAAEDAFPRAKVFTFFNYNASNDTMSALRRQIISSMLTLHGRVVSTIWASERCLSFYGGTSGSDGLHPSVTGSRLIAGEILSRITGVPFQVTNSAREITIEQVTQDVNYSAEIRGTPSINGERLHCLVQINKVDTSVNTPYTGEIKVRLPGIQSFEIQGSAAGNGRILPYGNAFRVQGASCGYAYASVYGYTDGIEILFDLHNATENFYRIQLDVAGQ